MRNTSPNDRHGPATGTSRRRDFIKRTAAAAVAGPLVVGVARRAHAQGSDTIRLGLVGCGGRGSGAAGQALRADRGAKLVAVADAFEDRIRISLNTLASQMGEQVDVPSQRQFVGFDGYQGVLGAGVDVVLLATPPHFRPLHLKAAIDAGKHVFAEKPVAVDAPGIRSVMESTELARRKDLFLVSGLNRRYSPRMQEMMQRIHDGAIGETIALHAVRYSGGVWTRLREPDMTEMQYQMRNWYYFTWLSGDFNTEQFVHEYDQVAWAMRDAAPVRVYSTGGRQARTGAEHGHIYDHFSSVFEYADGQRAFTTARHQGGCSNQSGVYVMGTKGTATMAGRDTGITGENPWRPDRGPERDSHQLEHDAFFPALREGRTINNGHYMANSTMMALAARMSAYTGQTLTWEEVMASRQQLAPARYAWDADPPPAEVAIPGLTEFI